MAIDNLNFSNETGQQNFDELPKDQRDTIIGQQHAEGNVSNRRIDELDAERNRLKTEGYTTSERTESLTNRIAGLESRQAIYSRIGNTNKAEELQNEIEQLQREKFEASEANVKQAMYDLIELIPDNNPQDLNVAAPKYDEEMCNKIADLLGTSVVNFGSEDMKKLNTMIQLTDEKDGKILVYICQPNSAQLASVTPSYYETWAKTPR